MPATGAAPVLPGPGWARSADGRLAPGVRPRDELAAGGGPATVNAAASSSTPAAVPRTR
ncbi:hypothetical protein AB0469_01965 [Streptomyces sp. NPDC093801]|uniref:hypothetical protein n=1 Tax=Streptomyces sp. NPDC093801 TaxID=3155203 RepID=UPI00344B7C71